MDTRTGAVAIFENDADAKRAGHDLPIKKEDVPKVMAMNRHDRRKWAAEQRQTAKQQSKQHARTKGNR